MALVLTRSMGEEILIDDGRIRIQVARINGNSSVRIAITAPPEVSIVRGELVPPIPFVPGELRT